MQKDSNIIHSGGTLPASGGGSSSVSGGGGGRSFQVVGGGVGEDGLLSVRGNQAQITEQGMSLDWLD